MLLILFYMFMMVIFFLIIFMFLFINNLSIYIEFLIINFFSLKIEFLILLDWISLLFSGVVIFISALVIYYSLEYMIMDLNIKRFIMLIMMFVMSMMLLIFSLNLISILMGWDGLGLVSYCLVIYYQSKTSFNSGMTTVVINRVGDILIMISISLFIMFGSWNFLFLNKLNFLIYLLLMVASFTKSAQVPFSSWLPLAMMAPTPVSSLVHSSTLVTAGVYLLIRLNYLLEEEILINMMMLMANITMLMSGLGANFEFDLKKIIALSTLSQLGVMIFSLSLNLMEISFFHLLTHAMFKSLLFMCSGVIIHNMMNNQDIRMISMIMFNLPLISMMFNCSSLSLCGIPFLSGFYSKDLILEMFLMSKFNMLMFIMLFISMGLTIMYSFRLMFYSFISYPQFNIYNKLMCMSSKMSNSMYLLFIMSVLSGSVLNWLMFSFKSIIYLTMMFKLMINFFIIFGILLGMWFTKIFMPLLLISFCNNYMKYFMMMWFFSILYMSVIPKLFIYSSSMNFGLEFSWLEFLGGKKFNIFFKYFFKVEYIYKNYLYMIILFGGMIILLIF